MRNSTGARGVTDEREPAAHAPGSAFARRPVLLLAALVVAGHVLVNLITPYGVHRDELLYLAMGRHLQLFRMDFPPLIAILAEVSRRLGDSLGATIAVGPLFLRPGALFQPVVFDQLWWTAGLLALSRIPVPATPHARARGR